MNTTKIMNNLFENQLLTPTVKTGLANLHFTKPTEVQRVVISKMLKGENCLVQAVTGSGKTHAFLVPIFNNLDPEKDYLQAVITAPSRELADQLYKVAKDFRKATGMDISILHLAGGTDRERQISRLNNKKPQLVIATPGRLLDFVQKKILVLDQLRTFIIDEADMTLDLGFLPDLDYMISRLGKDSQIAAFSATIPVKLNNFLNKYIKSVQEIVIDNPTVIAPTIKNDLLDIGSRDRKAVLYQLLTMGQPYLALVFANTKNKVDEITTYLQNQGLKVAKIHGGITERERRRVIRQVEEGQFQYVVASDLVARGIDIQGVSLVINYEISSELEFMIHRIGRTGRNGLPGHAISLITDDEMHLVGQLENLGIHFDFVELKKGQLVARKHHRAREDRQRSAQKLDPKLKGLVKKQKVKRKPGYKKKIREAIKKDAKQKRRAEMRQQNRQRRRQRRSQGN